MTLVSAGASYPFVTPRLATGFTTVATVTIDSFPAGSICASPAGPGAILLGAARPEDQKQSTMKQRINLLAGACNIPCAPRRLVSLATGKSSP